MILVEGMNQNFIEKCVIHMCEILGIDVPDLHIFVDETIKPNGACYQNSPDEFMIVLKDQADGQMIVTLAHEMVHVKQYLKDNLAEHFTYDIPYMERWWEKEAYAMEVEITKSIIEMVESGKI